MTTRSEHDVILDHAVRDDENLRIALKIGQAYPDLCGRIILGFLEAVEKELTPRLGSAWKVAIFDSAQLEGSEHCLEAHLLSYLGEFCVVLGAEGYCYPKKIYFGVRSDSPSHSELVEHVRDTLNAQYLKGYRGAWSFWYKYVDKAYSSWGSEDVTLLLYRKGAVVEYFVDHLEKLARAVERALIPSQ